MPDAFSVQDAEGWHDVGWHDVLTGGWDPAKGSMHWTRVSDSASVELPLVQPGHFPDVFRERVEATILFQQAVFPQPGRAITISARRDLADAAGAVTWTVHPGRGVRMEDPDTRAFAEAELRRLRSEYAF